LHEIPEGRWGPDATLKEVLMPNDNRSNRGNTDNRSDDRESRQSSGREGGRDSSTDRERDEQGRFESERGGSSPGGSSKKK
jgi:hypothetical protein